MQRVKGGGWVLAARPYIRKGDEVVRRTQKAVYKPRNYEQELGNLYGSLAESVLTMTDDELLAEAFEEYWEREGFGGDNPSAAIIPADNYSKFDFGLMCFKAGFTAVKQSQLITAAPDLLAYALQEEAVHSAMQNCDFCLEADTGICDGGEEGNPNNHLEDLIECGRRRRVVIAKAKGGLVETSQAAQD